MGQKGVTVCMVGRQDDSLVQCCV